MAEPTGEPPGKLVPHFASISPQDHAQGWSALWETGQSDLWDRGKPSPALVDYVESRPAVLQPRSGGRRLRALIPGCGKGYDVVMLALHGFDVYGLEVSEKGTQAAKTYAASELVRPHDHNYGNREEWLSTPPGAVTIIMGNFFEPDWQARYFEHGFIKFDLIYDYTFLCAILPEMRRSWAERMGELLAPTGVLVCLEFPLYKDLRAPGPPWGLRGVHWNLLARGEDSTTGEAEDEVESANGRFRRILYLNPARSYDSGKGTDMLSVWALKT